MTLRSTLGVGAATVLSASLVLVSPNVAQAAPHAAARHASSYVVPTGGTTTLRLDPATATTLTNNKISVAPAGDAVAGPTGIAFKIQGGLVNASTLAGKITHRGGLTFAAGGKKLTVRDFTINTKRKVLTGYVDELGARVPVLDLRLGKATVSKGPRHLVVRHVKALLNATTAAALNKYFGTTLFAGGLSIGTARIDARGRVLRG